MTALVWTAAGVGSIAAWAVIVWMVVRVAS